MHFILRLLLIAIAALASVRSVYADTPGAPDPFAKPTDSEARKHLALGNKLYGVRSFDEAAAEYKAGAIIEPTPVFDYNLGQCYRLTNRYQEAIWHYERFLSRGHPSGEVLAAVQEFISQMKAELEKKAMKQPPVEAAPPALPTSFGNVPSPSSPKSGAPLDTRTRFERDDTRDWVAWSLTGSGLIALGTSGVLFYSASRLDSRGDANADMRARQNLYDQASSRKLTGAILGIGGVALSAAGIVRFTLHHRASLSSTVINIDISSHGVFAAGSF